jgi:hypothetical protein
VPLTQLRVLYNAFVKGLFATLPRGSYHWEEGEGTEIWVSDENPVQADVVGMRPAVSFTRGPIQFYSLGMDDMLSYNYQTGKKTKVALIPGVMSINCSSRVQAESENIAFFVAEHLWLLREKLMGYDKFFEIGRQPQVSAPSPAEGIIAGDGGEEWYCTTVSSPFQFPRKSQFTPLNQTVVNEIQLQIQTQLSTLREMNPGGPSVSHNGVEVPVHTCESGPPSFFPEASDARGRTPDPAGTLPNPPTYAAHPLDPARQVRVRTIHPFRPGLRPPSMGGRAIPIADCRVEESSSTPPFKTKV